MFVSATRRSTLSSFVLSKTLPTPDGLFFIRKFQTTMVLVQINYEKTAILNIQPETIDYYHVTFFARQPADKYLSDDKYRW